MAVFSTHRALAVVALLAASAVPGHAESVGAGAVSGSVSFTAPGIPPANTQCRATSFVLDGRIAGASLSVGAVASVPGAQYSGPIELSGSGGSACENAGAGAGEITVSAQGFGYDGGELSCPALAGSFVRVGTDVTVGLYGGCTVNNTSIGEVIFFVRAEFLPGHLGEGVWGPVRTARFAGTFLLSPA